LNFKFQKKKNSCKNNSMTQLQLFETIDTFILDIDGVLTNNQLLVQNDGSLLRSMNIRDGYALQLAVKKNYNIVIISGGKNEGVHIRLQGLKVQHIHLGVQDKLHLLQQLVEQNIVSLSTSIYVGDDMPDVAPMKIVALPCAPADACWQAKQAAIYVSNINGGDGCVREIIEKVMTLKGDWE
jgi:3-deoxy-D-manno-octulosonate 8-phosphate phosphatase (KDO 8-P phosphatase)